MTVPIIDGGNAGSTFTPTSAPAASAGSVFAPDISSYAGGASYITPAQFLQAGTGVDVSQLVARGSAAANTAALARVIRQASSWADSLTNRAGDATLAATVDIQTGYYRPRGGMLTVPVKYKPVIEVVGISTGPYPWQLTAMSPLDRVGIVSPKLVQFAVGGYTCDQHGRVYVALSYVNGWPCTTLASPAAVGDTAIGLTSPVGVYPGMVLTLDDSGNTEQVTVAASYTPGTTGPVPLTAAISETHTAGVAASAMPEDIQRAVIALTACLIKTRGSQALVMQSMGSEPTNTEISQAGGVEDFELASDLLEPYRRAA